MTPAGVPACVITENPFALSNQNKRDTYIKYNPQNHSLMNNAHETYQSPQIVTIETEYEGVVCYSNEGLDEIPGEW